MIMNKSDWVDLCVKGSLLGSLLDVCRSLLWFVGNLSYWSILSSSLL